MASTSVMEPMVLLYRATGDKRYLDFAEYIVTAWDEQGGPRVLTALLGGASVDKVANGKAYEMTSNLVGLCELYRVTGKKPYLDAVLNAWKDISAHRLYITGSGSSHELWQADFHFPDDSGAQICETCVTVTWMQLNMELLRLLGEARFAEELEKTLYNHLLGAQEPTGDDWSYYTPLVGRKPYESVTTCCHSSGPRGVALAPEFLYAATQDGVAVNVFGASSATVPLTVGGDVHIEQKTNYPLDGKIELAITPNGVTKPFTLRLRPPVWASKLTVAVNQTSVPVKRDGSGYIAIARSWSPGDVVTCDIAMTPRIVLGDHENADRMAILYGPLALAADRAHNPNSGLNVENIAPATEKADEFKLRGTTGPGAAATPMFETDGVTFTGDSAAPKRTNCTLALTPYSAAGGDKAPICVWLKRPAEFKPTPQSLVIGATESRSRKGNQPGSIVDGDATSFAVTFDGAKPVEDWFAVAVARPVTIRRVVFVHGQLFHDGGWFDASAGKPKIQIQRAKDGPWEDLAQLDAYPATTATAPTGLKGFDKFTVECPPTPVVGIRVVGKPSSGDNPAQAFSSCAEISAY
jgi:hypothetical protein